MKRKALLLILLCALLLGIGKVAYAAYDPISVSMDLSKNEFTEPGDVTVSIRVSNVGDDRMPGPVYLYYPDGKAVTGFGDGGAAQLDIGGFETWTGTWRVTQKQLEDGKIIFMVKYPIVNDDGEISHKSKYFNKVVIYSGAAPGLTVNRTISPTMARKDQTVTITYDLANTGNVALNNIKLTENKSISNKVATIDTLAAGKSQQVKFEVTMGTKNLTSSATITYKATGSSTTSKETVEAQTITLGEANLSATLTASAAGVNIGDTVKLKLTLKNNGNISYSNLLVTDPTLGEVFSNLELAAGATQELEREITMLASGEYLFTITGNDNTGTEISVTTSKVAVNAVDPNKKLTLTVNAEVDSLTVYSQPATVRFTVSVTNTSESEAKDVKLSHGSTELTTFSSIKAGETKKIVRDTSISMAGRFQFSAACKDLLGNDTTFESNVITIAYAVPTPGPTTVPQRTPPPTPKLEPTPTAADLPTLFFTAQRVALILFGVVLVLLAAGIVLLILALIRRSAQKKQSESALDHLERGSRRDYTSPGDEEAAFVEDSDTPQEPEDGLSAAEDEEMPHMKYVRGDTVGQEDVPTAGSNPEDPPEAGQSSSLPTEEEAAILSGGTGHYRLARGTVSKEMEEHQAVSASNYSRRRRRSAKDNSEGGKPADM